MKKLVCFLAIMVCAFSARAQQSQISSNLNIAMKESSRKLDEERQKNILYYAKDNKPATVKNTSETEAKAADFYDVYLQNIQDGRHNGNADPVIMSMPAPGPNLDYYMIDRNSNGNYMTVKG